MLFRSQIIGVPEEEEKKRGSEKIFEEIIVENLPNMGKEIVNQVQEAQRAPYRINPRRNMPKHILIKLPKFKYKEKIYYFQFSMRIAIDIGLTVTKYYCFMF